MSTQTAWLVDNIIIPVENSLLKIGINSAFKAGMTASLITAGIYWAVKPSSAFDRATGIARPWALLDQSPENQIEPTLIPWYMGSIIVGYSVNLII